jgi:hypothetical protein
MAFASSCNNRTNSSTFSGSIILTAVFSAGLSNETDLVVGVPSIATSIFNGLERADIIPLMFGIRRSFSSTKPFLPPMTKGQLDLKIAWPPSISAFVVASEPLRSNPTQAFVNGKFSKAAIIAGTCCPL